MAPTFPPALLPTTENNNLFICVYGGYCRSTSDCVAGNMCDVQNQYYSQCIPDPSQYRDPSTGCVGDYGSTCSGSSVCCNPGSVCNVGSGYPQCEPLQPPNCIMPSGYSLGPSPSVSPSTFSQPSVRPSLKPTKPSNSQPSVGPPSKPTKPSNNPYTITPTTMAPTFPPALVPTTENNNLICVYGGFCRSTSDCVAGNMCDVQSQYYSQCIPDPSQYRDPSTGCVGDYGTTCTGSSVCCNPGSVCNVGSGYPQCELLQPPNCIMPSGYSLGPSPSVSPSTSFQPSVRPSLKPTKPSTAPTFIPSEPTIVSTVLPSSVNSILPPSSVNSNLICLYGGYCRSNADCVPGSQCSIQNQYYSQCIPDPSQYLNPITGCVADYSTGCSSSKSKCCNPGSVCSLNSQCAPLQSPRCSLPLGYSLGPSPSLSPSTSSQPSVEPSLQPTKPSPEPTFMPSEPTIESTVLPTPTPSFSVSSSPAIEDPLCCSTVSYAGSWSYCNSAAGLSMTSCATCAAYQCIDWTAGSAAMQAREQSYFAATGDAVYFGVGSYGNDQTRAGKCYRISASGIDRDLIVQVVNQGGDVPDGNFDLQVGDGGYGVFDACVSDGTSVPQFDGSGSQWGAIYGGWGDISGCDKLPQYPHCGAAPQDSMQDLCRWSFEKNIRRSSGNSNPTILNMCEVVCPLELYQATGLRRSDAGSSSYSCGPTGNSGGGLLTRMMDCTKPSYGWNGNVKGTTYPGYELVVPCRRDGYTRIDAMPSTLVSTASPSGMPRPTSAPSVAPTSPSARPSLIPTAPTAESTVLPTSSPTYANTVAPSPQSANPYLRTTSYYVNPTYQAELRSSISTAAGLTKMTLQSMLEVSSAYWIDVKAKINGLSTTSAEGILYDASTKATKQLVTFVVYDLPNRDCHVSAHSL